MGIGRFSAAARGCIATLIALMAISGVSQGAEKRNMKLAGHVSLQARSAYQPIVQQYQDGSWIAFVGHHNGRSFNPATGMEEVNGVSVVDVTIPANPRYLWHIPAAGGAQMVQTCSGDDLPDGDAGKMYLLRSNGNVSHEIWDVSNPLFQQPSKVTDVVFVGTAEDGGRGTHKNWWDCETGLAFLVSSVDGWRDRRIIQVFDLADPATPRLIRNFGLVGQEPGSTLTPVPAGAHEATLLGDRLYIPYGTSSGGIFQIVDVNKLLECDSDPLGCPTNPTPDDLLYPQVARLNMPSFWGGHTAFPLLGMEIPEMAHWPNGSPADFVALVSESTRNECGAGNEAMHHMMFMVNITEEANPFPVANYNVPESSGSFCSRGGRFGSHSSNWSFTPTFYKKLIFIAYFNAGVRAVDIRDPYNPKEAAFYIPDTTAETDERCIEVGGVDVCKVAIQTNNVEVDDRGYVYLADRANTGLHIVELNGEARKIAGLR